MLVPNSLLPKVLSNSRRLLLFRNYYCQALYILDTLNNLVGDTPPTDLPSLKLKNPIIYVNHGVIIHFADRTGLEPATSAVTGQHSNQLNYRSFY